MASGLHSKAPEAQVDTFIYSMGDEADDILRSFDLSAENKQRYEPVKEKFDAHFVKKRNVIFERAKFNMRKQDAGESVDNVLHYRSLCLSRALQLRSSTRRDDS